jgi:hypothetical protein
VKCSPVCPFKNTNCCMARLLSKQDNFWNQISLLEEKLHTHGHIYVFLPKFHCELNPIEMVCLKYFYSGIIYWTFYLQYWGWAKHRYRDVYKDKFEEAKKIARECLDACTADIIRRFFNQSWRFMDTYRKGLTGKAAEWAVRQQRSHRRVGQGAMMSLEAVLN